MDLDAYAQIDNLDAIAKANKIEVPRLRGYRLMKDESPIDYKDTIKHVEVEACQDLICSSWNPNSCCHTYSSETKEECAKLISNYDNYYKCYDPEYKGPEVKVNWELLTESQTKLLRDEIEHIIQDHKKQYEVWNKYVGRDDVLYIHARIGGGNWEAYDGPSLTKESWFLDKVDDCVDCTYCDIYAKISVFPEVTEEES